MIEDNAVYVGGHRREPGSLGEAYQEVCNESGGFAWTSLREPTEREIAEVRREFGLPDSGVGDAHKGRQRPRVQSYGETVVVFLRPALYVDEQETVRFGEMHIFVGEDFLVTVSHGEGPDLGELRRQLEKDPNRLDQGPGEVLLALIERIVSGYTPVVEGLDNDVDEIEEEVFADEGNVSRRIYELSREAIRLHQAVEPLSSSGLEHFSAANLRLPESDGEGRLRSVRERASLVLQRIDSYRQLLDNIQSVHLTQVSIRQNTQARQISAWAAILAVPTIIAGIYGMNFQYMPELGWSPGYPLSLLLIVVIAAVVYIGFKRSGWL